MRVTNMMTTNQLLLNLNKSMNSLAFLQYQAETGNKIRYASDDPIIAGRSLKFRTNIVETQQYLSNVDQGRSWLQTTASSVKNVLEALSNEADNSIRSILVGASNGTYTLSDYKIFATQLRETLSEIKGELNTTYAGRYIFSGYKTDEPPTFPTDNSSLSMNITQAFSIDDITQDYKVYSKDAETDMPREISCYRLKLAYDEGIDPASITGVNITNTRNSTDAGAYEPGANDIYFLKDTGELIFGADAYEAVKANTVSDNFSDESGTVQGIVAALNPPPASTPDEIKAATTAAKSLLNKLSSVTPSTTSTDSAIANLQTVVESLTGNPADTAAALGAMNAANTAILSGSSVALQSLYISYDKTGFKAGEINPKAYFTSTDLTSGLAYNMDEQTIMYEFSINNRMQVNTLAKDTLTASLMNDIEDLIRLVDGVSLTDRDKLIERIQTDDPTLSMAEVEKYADEQLENEEKFYLDMFGAKATKLLGKVDKHQTSISLQNTSIGSRLQRLDLISNRLQDDKVNFEDLKSQNDSVDASEVYVRYSTMSAVYQSALQTGAKVIQMSLVNFI